MPSCSPYGRSRTLPISVKRVTPPRKTLLTSTYMTANATPAQTPLFGADGDGGSVWGRLGDQLVASGAFDRMGIITFGIGGTSLRRVDYRRQAGGPCAVRRAAVATRRHCTDPSALAPG